MQSREMLLLKPTSPTKRLGAPSIRLLYVGWVGNHYTTSPYTNSNERSGRLWDLSSI
jgi:hypothetical protein